MVEYYPNIYLAAEYVAGNPPTEDEDEEDGDGDGAQQQGGEAGEALRSVFGHTEGRSHGHQKE